MRAIYARPSAGTPRNARSGLGPVLLDARAPITSRTPPAWPGTQASPLPGRAGSFGPSSAGLRLQLAQVPPLRRARLPRVDRPLDLVAAHVRLPQLEEVQPQRFVVVLVRDLLVDR